MNFKYNPNILKRSLKSNTKNDIEELDGGIKMFNDPRILHSVDAYLDQEISDLKNYRNLLQFMHNMEPDDEMRIWIDSPGGYLQTARAIIEAMSSTEGQVTCIISGSADSAASLIALCSPNLLVSENATMMIHNASVGFEGKHGDIEAFVDFNRSMIRNLMKKVYRYFLTEEEISNVLMGKDYYFNYDDIIARLERRAELLQKDKEAVESKDKTEVKPAAKTRSKHKVDA
jgi:ATP-dependent Clp protease protease subunit